MKRVKKLSKEDIVELYELYSTNPIRRIRIRAHCILLSSKDYPIKAISKILNHSRISISLWIDKFNKNGINGLPDADRCGRTPILTDKEENEVLKIVSKNSRSLNQVVLWIKENFQKDISKDTLKRILKKKDMFGNGCAGH